MQAALFNSFNGPGDHCCCKVIECREAETTGTQVDTPRANTLAVGCTVAGRRSQACPGRRDCQLQGPPDREFHVVDMIETHDYDCSVTCPSSVRFAFRPSRRLPCRSRRASMLTPWAHADGRRSANACPCSEMGRPTVGEVLLSERRQRTGSLLGLAGYVDTCDARPCSAALLLVVSTSAASSSRSWRG